jgi:hypothetical protein
MKNVTKVVIIGSVALSSHTFNLRTPVDTDLVCTYEALQQYLKQWNIIAQYPISKGKKIFAKTSMGHIFEAEIAWENSIAEKLIKLVEDDKDTIYNEANNLIVLTPSLDVLYMLKMSHRFLKNSPHFLKTMRDIQLMRKIGAKIRPEHQTFYKERQKETYNYSHPKLDVKKDEFFDSDKNKIVMVYDHDSIHEAVKHLAKPAYTYYQKDNEEVACSKEKFFAVDESVRLYGVLEEAYVLALERSQIPFKEKVDPYKSFCIALMKISTSITSGYFRTFCWENYDKALAMYNSNYVLNFWDKVKSGVVKLVAHE